MSLETVAQDEREQQPASVEVHAVQDSVDKQVHQECMKKPATYLACLVKKSYDLGNHFLAHFILLGALTRRSPYSLRAVGASQSLRLHRYFSYAFLLFYIFAL